MTVKAQHDFSDLCRDALPLNSNIEQFSDRRLSEIKSLHAFAEGPHRRASPLRLYLWAPRFLTVFAATAQQVSPEARQQPSTVGLLPWV